MINYLPSGKENALFSLWNYLNTQLAAVVWTSPYVAPNVYPVGYGQTIKYPVVILEDVGAPAQGGRAFNRNLGGGKQGTEEITIVRVLVQDQNRPDDATPYTNAQPEVLRLRDLIRYALYMAGEVNDNTGPGTVLPGIRLLDHQNSDADTGSQVWMPISDPAHWSETFINGDEATPSLKQYRINIRIKWNWFQN